MEGGEILPPYDKMSKVEHAIFQGLLNNGGGIRLGPQGVMVRYPNFMYKDGCDPLTVQNTDQEMEARKNGYDTITASSMANPWMINWYWDLEDMSPKQLRIFAKEEFNVDLPVDAKQEILFKAICELSRNAPQNKNRLVLMAHTISLNYDATIEEIKRLHQPGVTGVETETHEFEVWA